MKKNIKQLRKEKGIKQQEMAQILGISSPTLRKYENNPRQFSDMKLDLLFKIIDVLNVSIEDVAITELDINKSNIKQK